MTFNIRFGTATDGMNNWPNRQEMVVRMLKHLWRDGGCIAQCEFGAGAKPENVRAVFEAWDELFAHEDDQRD